MKQNPVITPVATVTLTGSSPVPSLTFVCCIEAGPMEKQVMLLVESLRRFGGRFAACDILAVRPRRGLPLAAQTRKTLRQLGVTYRTCSAGHDASWYANLNKATALAFVETQVETEQICWLDSDILIAREPSALELKRGEDFAAMPASTRHDIGVAVDTSDHAPYWEAVCADLGLDFTAMPLIPSQTKEATRMRMYWQGGTYTYRRESRLGERHQEIFLRRLKGAIASRHAGTYFYDQSSLALAVWQAGLRWRVLPESHNFALNKLRGDEVDNARLPDAHILHYFGSMWPDFFPTLEGWVARANPALQALLAAYGPLENNRTLPVKAGMWAVKQYRQRRQRAFARSCTFH